MEGNNNNNNIRGNVIIQIEGMSTQTSIVFKGSHSFVIPGCGEFFVCCCPLIIFKAPIFCDVLQSSVLEFFRRFE
jgi:hypothetical protein